MNWSGWSEFWSIDGEGLYVWAAYLVALLMIVAEVVVLTVSRRSIDEHLGRYAGTPLEPSSPKILQARESARHGVSD